MQLCGRSLKLLCWLHSKPPPLRTTHGGRILPQWLWPVAAAHLARRAAAAAPVAQLAMMRAKDVAKEHEWGSRLEVRDCPADLAADTDIPVVLTMLSNAAGELSKHAMSCSASLACLE